MKKLGFRNKLAARPVADVAPAPGHLAPAAVASAIPQWRELRLPPWAALAVILAAITVALCDRWNEYTRTWYATTQAELRHFERIAGVPSSAPAGVPNHGLDLASVAILMIIGSAIGMAISAGSLAAILTEKAATVRLEAAPAPGPGSIIDVPSGHAGESADGFEAWARQCVSKLDGGKVRPAEAHASYLQFAARNDFARPLAIQEFGRRFNGYLANAYGIDGRHSNGTVFDGIALAPIGHALAVEGR